MKFLVFSLLAITLTAFSARAEDPMPIPRLEGLYNYQDDFIVTLIRRVEDIPDTTAEGKARVKQLRKEGHSCGRKNPQVARCVKSEKPNAPMEELRAPLANLMRTVDVEFYPGEEPPVLSHNGSSTQEWLLKDTVRLMKKKLNLYFVVRSYEGRISLSFPVSEGQPIGNLIYHGADKLGLQLTASHKESPSVTIGYVMEAYLKPGL
ncbi:hypothetical protein EZJ49_10110 [Bdellovibrio bacteriovorus]|uniref:hypothetical protein n=1 Tax=Bdellovibrio bacteriovorus TaxID=959 RepID=UPI0021D1B9C0|nr:hypothetical protein [Bdellovibrio bacteriovorus]UXR63428.1 hypothetical protein EZJ49_10110 [Bdellovibrio bacteriovorus]